MNVLGVIVCVAIALTVCLPEVSSKGQLGEICNQDLECKIFGSACFDGYCMCKPTHEELNGLCVVEFGKPCLSGPPDICKGTNVTCRSLEKWEIGYPSGFTCMCLLNYTLHTAPDTCRAKIGMPCNVTKTGECNDGSCLATACKNGLCAGATCTEDNGEQCRFGVEEGTCWSGECMVETCIQATNICPIGKCNCTWPGLVPTKNKARCFPDLDKPCTERCADTNAECSKNKLCTCKANYQKSKSLVWDQECKKSLGMTCNTPKDCAPEEATCISLSGKEKVCVCGSGFVAKQDRSDCLKEAANYGSPCEEDLQCQVKLGKHSECKADPKEKTCVCKAKYEFDEDDGICVRA